MYSKRILILQQTNARFAERKKELCGMVKAVNGNGNRTEVTVFVTNADITMPGEWWLLAAFDNFRCAHCLDTLNNCTFSLPEQPLQNVSCVLVKREDACYEAARTHVGNDRCDILFRQCDSLVAARRHDDEREATSYERFVASTDNYYDNLDVSRLKLSADERYRSVQDYSNAFERFYASGGNDEYYQSVKNEISKVFLQFPPYYPLIRKYSESFFVRIDFPSSDKYFVLGVLQKDGEIRYICYGLPALQENFTDKDFVYVDNSPVSFWMLFQDASTGQISVLNDLV